MERTAEKALLRELKETEDLAGCLQRNQARFRHQTVAEGLTNVYKTRSISKAELARRSDVSLVYLHQVFAGRRMPSRDRLLGLCVGMRTTLDETQMLLQLAVYAPLCPCNRRDAILIYGIVHHHTLADLREELVKFGEAPFY